MECLELLNLYVSEKKPISSDMEIFGYLCRKVQDASRIISEINGGYHTPEEIRMLFSKLIGKEAEGLALYPPFFAEIGVNITVGENVFINAMCSIQDQGGVFIGDGTFIGSQVSIATINHDLDPDKRDTMYLEPVHIGPDVWIGNHSTILPGITIGDGAVIGAGSVVTKNVEPRTVVAGNPAKVLKRI